MAYTTADQHGSGYSTSRTSTVLAGIKPICQYMGKSASAVLRYIRGEGLPAAKIGGGWVSDKARIDEWRLRRIDACAKSK